MPRIESEENDPVVRSSNQPDYSTIEIPSKARSEYSWQERRAELLQLVEEAGAPGLLNQTQLADRYDVSQQQISKDFKKIAEHVHDRVTDRDRRAFTVGSVVERAITGLADEGEWRKAAKTAMEYEDWLSDFHDQEEVYRRLDRLEKRTDDT